MSYLIDDEKCPKCDEGWITGKGLDCANNCKDKILEEKHRTAAQPMVDYCLPNWGVKVDCPNNWEEPKEGEKIKWSKANVVNRTITIPWYTLRNKQKFFHAPPHEVAHISAHEKRFDIPSKKVFKGLQNLIQKRQITSPNSQVREEVEKELMLYINKHQKTILNYWKYMELTKGGHEKNPWYSDYVDFHKKLLNSSFAEYAYGKTTPLPYRENFDGD